MSPTGSFDGTISQSTAFSLFYSGAESVALAEENPDSVKNATLVAYTHRPNATAFQSDTAAHSSTNNMVVCTNFDDLLNLLEVDAVEEIMFDSSVSAHEVSYITRWARIFKPSLRSIRTSPHSPAIFSSQHSLPTV
jgi:hypothetical protein